MEFGKNRTKHLTRVLRRDPDAYEPNLQMGLHCLRRGDFSAAIPYLEKAASKSDESRIHFLLANAHSSLNHPTEGEYHFKKALSLEPENSEYLRSYGLHLKAADRIEEAISALQKAASIELENYELWNDIGVLCFQRKRYEEAVKNIRKSLEINPQYTTASVNLGYVFLAMNRFSDVQKTIDSIDSALYDGEVMELRRQFSITLAQQSAMPDLETNLAFSDQLFQIKPLRIVKDFGTVKSCEPLALSVVIPIFNEAENINVLYGKLKEVLSDLRQGYEIVFVDDGSTDGSREELIRIALRDRKIKVIQFRRNYGQTAALNAGFKYARGSVVVTLDGDLQNDPADIPKLLEKMAEGYDLVSGWRKNRMDTLITRKIPSYIANKIINKLIEGTGVQLHDFGCTLKAYKRGIVKNIQLYGEMHRYVPVFAAWLGVKVTEIPVNHSPRLFGTAKYNLSRVSRVIFDLIVVRFFSDYMTRPIQFFGRIAKKLAVMGVVVIAVLGLLSLTTTLQISFNMVVMLIALLLFAILQIISMGLLGEIMIRSYFETQNKDYYVVENIVNDAEIV